MSKTTRVWCALLLISCAVLWLTLNSGLSLFVSNEEIPHPDGDSSVASSSKLSAVLSPRRTDSKKPEPFEPSEFPESSKPTDSHDEKALEAFSFALVGDLPYGHAQVKPFEQIIADVNADTSIGFVVHVGDIKSGYERCDDQIINERFSLFQRFNGAFIYTPGDNEWTDCHRKNNGGFDPLERLAFLRKTFFPVPGQSSGTRPISLLSQAQTTEFSEFVENTRFIKNKVVFATLHVVGSNNGLALWEGYDANDTRKNPSAERIGDFEHRRDAALAWLNATFKEAEQVNARGIFIIMHANPQFGLKAHDRRVAGFLAITQRLQELSANYGGPVVLAHGDYHRFILDNPFETPPQGPSVANFTRLQTLGSPRIGWVKITVTPESRELFIYEKRAP